jgi:hypothetical protein
LKYPLELTGEFNNILEYFLGFFEASWKITAPPREKPTIIGFYILRLCKKIKIRIKFITQKKKNSN